MMALQMECDELKSSSEREISDLRGQVASLSKGKPGGEPALGQTVV